MTDDEKQGMRPSYYQIENMALRRMLWHRHGCPFEAKYYDDGEMQCNGCKIDFRRDAASIIEMKFIDMGVKKLIEAEKKNGGCRNCGTPTFGRLCSRCSGETTPGR